MTEHPDAQTILRLTLSRGVFNGEIAGDSAPAIDLRVEGKVVGAAEVSPIASGFFRVTAPVPASALSDGVSTVVFVERGSGMVLARYPFRAGAALDGDVVVTLDALQAELDALKRAFMAEAADGKLRGAERPLIVAEAVEEALRAVSETNAIDVPGAKAPR